MSLARRVGLGYRPELSVELLRQPTTIGFCEVVAESCFARRESRDEAVALRALWPVVPHGVKLSLGSADGIDEARLGRLAELCRALAAPLVSEHIAFTRGGGREIGHLTQLPRTREAVRVLARNVAQARRRLPDIPLLLENVAWSVRWPDDEMDEATFHHEVARATGCPLLLDVGNLYANAVNEGLDPAAVLDAYPLDRVAMLHVAGGVREHGFYFDTHAHPIPDEVMALAARALARCPDAPILVERDGNFGDFAALRGELERLQALRPAARGGIATRSEGRPEIARSDGDAATVRLAARQEALARLLTDPSLPALDGAAAGSDASDAGAPSIAPGPVAPDLAASEAVGRGLARALGLTALARARGILERKRVDDALPLLGRLGRRIEELRPLAEDVIRRTPRAPRGAGPADALAIAEAAREVTALAEDAARDHLILRARFVRHADGSLLPRRGPFLGGARLLDGTRLRAWKGVGAFASVLFTTRPPARKGERAPWRWTSPDRSRSPGASSSA